MWKGQPFCVSEALFAILFTVLVDRLCVLVLVFDVSSALVPASGDVVTVIY